MRKNFKLKRLEELVNEILKIGFHVIIPKLMNKDYVQFWYLIPYEGTGSIEICKGGFVLSSVYRDLYDVKVTGSVYKNFKYPKEKNNLTCDLVDAVTYKVFDEDKVKFIKTIEDFEKLMKMKKDVDFYYIKPGINHNKTYTIDLIDRYIIIK